jgi:hypothetical protein
MSKEVDGKRGKEEERKKRKEEEETSTDRRISCVPAPTLYSSASLTSRLTGKSLV